MKNQIIAFILLITNSLCIVTITTVNTGTYTNSLYTFTLTGNTDTALGKTQTTTVTLLSPTRIIPTCTVSSEDPSTTTTKRFATGDVTIICTISSALNSVIITVSEVKVNRGSYYNSITEMTGTAIYSGSLSGCRNTDEEEDFGKFIQLSGFLLMIILFDF